ncbi:class I adenylate-forming enzyme family protein [Mycobacterium sp. 1164985.4]|uniref:class I adenylate-forming enzyme family protein n=1 Tax=Mycobacterium sp. 1164985.4 TaxID=1834069 RepID=UPI0007FEB64D|nr:class I adenylate-forming enzyme family protein [Mycobacterium sp. 1164985.4]OBK80384.1 AMP-binding protein [Mycobacterium sp. 1164985.4]
MPDRTVGAVLRTQARARGDHPLLICDTNRLSYAEAERRSARLARGLIMLGAGKGTHVGVLYPNGSAFVVAMLAVARIGAVVIPISTMATAPEMREQLAHADVEILLTAGSYRNHDYRQRLADVDGLPLLRHILIDTEAAGPADAGLLAALEDDVEPCDEVAIIYTSGSTSAPKGVVHTHAALLDHQVVLNEIRGLTAEVKLFSNSPFFWIGGFAYSVLATLLAGATLLCSNAVDPGVTLDLLEAEKPTMTNGFVAGIAHLARHPSLPNRDLSSIRRGNLYPIMAPEVRPADPELRHTMLGMTESGSVILACADESDQPEHRRGSFGKPVPGFEVKVVDSDRGGPVSVGAVGELCARGPFMMQRYYRRSREECFDADGWFHTGDLVRTDADGFFYFVGRRGAMIKTAGANVAPAEVERAIAKVTGGAVAHVIGLPDAERGQIVGAVVALEDGASFDEAACRERLKAELSAFKIPRRFAAVPAARIPVLSSGKVDLSRLTEVFDV